MRNIGAAVAFIGAIWAGVYLCLNDYPTLGGWICILSLLGQWGFEKNSTED